MEGATRHLRFFALAVTIAALIGSCGSDGSEPRTAAREPVHPITTILNRLQKAFSDGDLKGICELMTSAARTEAGNVAHSEPTRCEKDVGKVFALIEKGGGWSAADMPAVAKIDQAGDSSSAVLSANGWRARVPFVRASDSWKIAGFIGMGRQRIDQFAGSARRARFPATGTPAMAAKPGGAACGAITYDREFGVSGGCQVEVSIGVPIEMLTPYGGFEFGKCQVNYRMTIDGAGRTLIDEWLVGGPGGCPDISPCYAKLPSGRPYVLPWRGRLGANHDGTLTHRTDMCLDTCVGVFAGDFSLRLVRAGNAWRFESTQAGTTGFRFGRPSGPTAAGLRLANA